MSDDQFEIGYVSLTQPQWWWDHSDEFDEVMRVAADWDDAVRIERRQPGGEEPEVEPATPRRLTLTVEEAADTLGIHISMRKVRDVLRLSFGEGLSYRQVSASLRVPHTCWRRASTGAGRALRLGR